jgi:hypothetical protein
MSELNHEQKSMMRWSQPYVVIELENVGGLVSPVPVTINYSNGNSEELRLPVDIWRKNPGKFRKLIPVKGDISSVEIDKNWETGDVDRSNNIFPRPIDDKTYELQFKEDPPENPMQKAQKSEENDDN